MDPANSVSDASLLMQARWLCDDPYFRQVVWRHGAHLGTAADAARYMAENIDRLDFQLAAMVAPVAQ